MVLKCPDLGPGSGHQILKVGDAEQTQEEAFFFGKINLRMLTEPDLLTLSAVICHLCLLYLKVADVGGHNVGWQVETLAFDPEENQRLQADHLRSQEHVRITLYDAERWKVQASKNFPSQKNLKGFWGMISKFPELSQWFSRAVKEHYLPQEEPMSIDYLNTFDCSSYEPFLKVGWGQLLGMRRTYGRPPLRSVVGLVVAPNTGTPI